MYWNGFAQTDAWNNLFRSDVIWVVIPVVAIICAAWVKVVRERSRSALKQSMVERGMTVEEINRVLKA